MHMMPNSNRVQAVRNGQARVVQTTTKSGARVCPVSSMASATQKNGAHPAGQFMDESGA